MCLCSPPGCHEDVHAHASERPRPHREQGDPVVRLPVGDQEVLGRGAVHRLPAGQTQGRDCHQRPPGHAEEGRDLPQHRVRLPVRARAQAQARPLQNKGRLHLQERCVLSLASVWFSPIEIW
ncbi:hypothetical protein CEXT_344681 [Caerostris extrusa]|uniref:Uncharacterized protein n=1 Tax=Caerostris extrusa TaxID=172846 RepID=A0AAV4P5N8_CAEEX|nr:hypothetical protein CEXT_344681 [Caerostris extrusa]